MTYEATAILARLRARQPGSIFGALWSKQLKTLSAHSDLKVTKETRTTVRAGIAHDNRAVVQDARAAGELPAKNAGLPWGEWESFPYVIAHKGERYVRLYPVASRVPKVIYRINGKMASKDEVRQVCPVSEFPEHKETGCFTLKLSNLKRLI